MTRAHRLRCIRAQVDQKLVQLRGVRHYGRRVVWHLAKQRDTGRQRRTQQLLHFGNQRRKPNGRARSFLLRAEGSKTLYQIARAIRRLADLLHATPRRVSLGQIVQQQLNVADD